MNDMHKDMAPLLYRAARRGAYGRRLDFDRGGITDALFVYLDGEPDPQSLTALESRFAARPWVCLTDAWERCVRRRYPDAKVYRRTRMKPMQRFRFPPARGLPPGYRLAAMDAAAFDAHPFSHGANYPTCEAFLANGAGAVVWHGDEIVSAASSFLSLDGEVELDVSSQHAHRGQGLASACVERMLRDCEARGLLVHWDAQNDASRHLAEKFGFEAETDYAVYWYEKT